MTGSSCNDRPHMYIYTYILYDIFTYWLCNYCFSFPFHFPFWWLWYSLLTAFFCIHVGSKWFKSISHVHFISMLSISISFSFKNFRSSIFSHFYQPFMGLLGYPLLDLNMFEYFLNSRFCRKKQLLLLDLIWVWGMFRVKRQEWKWIPVNGSDTKWKERKENEDPTKKSLPKVVKLYSLPRFISHVGEGADCTDNPFTNGYSALLQFNLLDAQVGGQMSSVRYEERRHSKINVGVLINYRTIRSSNHPRESLRS